MKLTFLGGADEVGASCLLLEIVEKKILIDAGIRISPKSSRGIENSQLPDLQPISDGGGIDFILVTHAHTDHTGALPMIVEQYPHTPVYMTRPTLALTKVLQQDAQRIMKNKHEEEGELPLFDDVAVDLLMQAVEIIEFSQPIKLGEGLVVTYHVSGHIAGAGLLVFESGEGTLVISGDISKSPQRTVKSIDVPRIKADVVVLESTYGGKLHAERRAEEMRLMETLVRVTERGGKVLIPAFALGRAQEVIQIILAYRDQLKAPVYVDGMVRSVCDAYNQFSDLLPEKTVSMARDEHLFFRHNVNPVRNIAERSTIATASEPCVIVASSGMLTGGASVYYAQHLAPVEENAILLTGYQDEEAPGRFLQRLMQQRNDGETPSVRFADKTVKVRCEVGTYSLSAHADESELVTITSALKPSHVMLVHGDHGARHSLATALRRRQLVVTTPKIGTVKEFSFKGKPWAIGDQMGRSADATSLSLEDLWLVLKERAGDYFSARELAQAWWGDSSRENEMLDHLNHSNNIYFVPDWRSHRNFKIQTQEAVNRTRRQQAIMLSYPDIVGKVVVLRNSNDQPRLGIVREADETSFKAQVLDAKGTNFPADALLWVIGDWHGVPGVEGSAKKQLRELERIALSIGDVLLPFALRQDIAQSGNIINPETLISPTLPEGVDRQTALINIVLKLAQDGAELVEGGIKTHQASETGPVNQALARDTAMSIFPPEANLRKVGMDTNRFILILHFDFPQVAVKKYAKLIEQISINTGWRTDVKMTINQQALGATLNKILPPDNHLTKSPSYHLDKNEVHITVNANFASYDISQTFYDLTGVKLIIQRQGEPKVTTDAADSDSSVMASGQKMEINQAYGLIRSHLDAHGLYKVGLKAGRIALSFISPQVGERHMETIQSIAEQTGYELFINPHPNQQAILQLATELALNNNLFIKKGPSIFIQRGEVSISTAPEATDNQREEMARAFIEATGYQLVFN